MARLVLHVSVPVEIAKAYRMSPKRYERTSPTGGRTLQRGAIKELEAHHDAAWHSQLSAPQRAAVHFYSDQVNGAPRLNRPLRTSGGDAGSIDPEVRHHAAHLDAALSHPAARVTHPDGLLVHRGISGDFAQHFIEKHAQGALVGSHTTTDHGYTSTSLDRSIGRKFGPQFMPGDRAQHHVIHQVIHVPPGARGAALGRHSMYSHEHEFLLPRGTTLLHTHMERVEPTDEMRASAKRIAAKTGKPVESLHHYVMHSVVTQQRGDA